MKMPEIRKKAESIGVTPGKMNKTDLIRAIQQAENYTPCFATTDGHCDNTNCCFIKDCLKVRQKVSV